MSVANRDIQTVVYEDFSGSVLCGEPWRRPDALNLAT
jgi:hypothetical protein